MESEVTTQEVVDDIPITATEQLISSSVEIFLYILAIAIVAIYIRFRNCKLFKKLKIEPASLINGLLKIINGSKNKIKQLTIRKTREHNIKIDSLDKNFTADEIKEVTDVGKEELQDVLKDIK